MSEDMTESGSKIEDKLKAFLKYQTRVFVSHKSKSDEVAEKFVSIIDHNSKRIGLFRSALIDKGSKWRPAIFNALDAATDLVLLFTDPNEQWDWCLYETGFYEAVVKYKANGSGTVVLHPEGAPVPTPLDEFQNVPVRQRDVEDWLSRVYRNEEDKEKKNISTTASRIVHLFSSVREQIFDANRIRIKVPSISKAASAAESELPKGTILEAPRELLIDVAHHVTPSIDWSELRRKLLSNPETGKANAVWLKEISTSIRRLFNRDAPALQSVLLSDTRRYRAVMDRVFGTGDDGLDCEMLIVTDVGGPTRGLAEGASALLASLRMAVRIRLEVIERYGKDVRDGKVTTAVRHGLKTAFYNIFTEAEFRFLFQEKNLPQAFEAGDQERLAIMSDQFEKAKTTIESAIAQSEGDDDSTKQPFSDEQLASLKASMETIGNVNREYLNMAAARVPAIIGQISGLG